MMMPYKMMIDALQNAKAHKGYIILFYAIFMPCAVIYYQVVNHLCAGRSLHP